MARKRPGPGRGERSLDFVLLEDGPPPRVYAKAGGRCTVLIFADAELDGELLRFSEALDASVFGDIPFCGETYRAFFNK